MNSKKSIDLVLYPYIIILHLFVILPAMAVIEGCGTQTKTPSLKPPFPIVTAENLFAVHAPDKTNIWIVGFNGSITHSSDGGNTWQFQNSGVGLNLCDVSFVSPQKGWIAGRAGTILHTADGGKTWTKQKSTTDKHLFAIWFADESNGWAAGDFGTIIHTSDGGTTWVSQGTGEDKIYNDVFFIDQQHGWLVGEFGLIYHTSDGGQHWVLQECKDIIPVVDETEWATPTPSLYSVWFADTQHGWATGMDATIIATQDGGRTWQKLKNPAENNKFTLYKIVIHEGSGWVVGQKGTYLYSHDSGKSWEDRSSITNTKFWLIDMSFPDKQLGWAVGSRGTIIKTEDGGKIWNMLSGVPLSFK